MGHTTPIDKLVYHQSITHKQSTSSLENISKELLTNLVLHSKWDVTILLIQNKNSLCNLPELGYRNICSPWLGLSPICDCFLERKGLFYKNFWEYIWITLFKCPPNWFFNFVFMKLRVLKHFSSSTNPNTWTTISCKSISWTHSINLTKVHWMTISSTTWLGILIKWCIHCCFCNGFYGQLERRILNIQHMFVNKLHD